MCRVPTHIGLLNYRSGKYAFRVSPLLINRDAHKVISFGRAQNYKERKDKTRNNYSEILGLSLGVFHSLEAAMSQSDP